MQITGALGGLQHTANFTLSDQVTTFQVTSATGSAIVHNTGVETQIVHSVPASNAPTYTTCTTADPNVTCHLSASG